jgi:hypothetical protein
MAIKPGFRFPTSSFSVEGFVKVARGSGGRFMFSYNFAGNDNCILVRSTVGTYGVWVHWAMNIDSSRTISHYINGQYNTGVLEQRTFCGSQGGVLVLGHDQDAPGGRLNANQVNLYFVALPFFPRFLAPDRCYCFSSMDTSECSAIVAHSCASCLGAFPSPPPLALPFILHVYIGTKHHFRQSPDPLGHAHCGTDWRPRQRVSTICNGNVALVKLLLQ